MGDVFYEPDIDIDGYSPTTMRIEIQRIIVEAINTALEQAGAPLPDHLVMVLQRPDRGVA